MNKEKKIKLRIKIFEKYDGHCAYCGKKLDINRDFIIEHINPIKKGGKSEPNNYNPSCGNCNLHKLGLDLEEFRQRIFNIPYKHLKDQAGLYFRICRIKPKSIIFYFERINGKV